MKKFNVLTVFLGALVAISVFYLIRMPLNKHKHQAADTVFIGPKGYGTTFDQSVRGAKPFYDLFNKALDASKAGDQGTAIKLLNESLPYVGIGIEKGMVYKKLAEIYRTQGNLEKELFYVEQWPKYSMNAQLNGEASRRAAEIRQILSSHNPSTVRPGEVS